MNNVEQDSQPAKMQSGNTNENDEVSTEDLVRKEQCVVTYDGLNRAFTLYIACHDGMKKCIV